MKDDTTTKQRHYRILEMRSENIKRISAVEIRPRGNVVEITGPNANGKTSLLDTVMFVLAGGRAIQWQPIRDGAEEARGQIVLGEDAIDYIVTRHFTRADGKRPPYTTKLEVRTPNGDVIRSPQDFLNALIGPHTFEPLAFVDQMDARAQLEFLKQLVPYDFAGAEDRVRQIEAERVAVGRLQREQEGAASAVRITPEMMRAGEPEDVAALSAELAKAGRHNADVEVRRGRRAAASQEADAKVNEAERLRAQAASLIKRADALETEAVAIEIKLNEAPALPAPIDTSDLETRIALAGRQGELMSLLRRRREHEAEAVRHKAHWHALTEERDAIAAAKRKAIAEARLPVQGLGFADDHVTLDGHPLDQASHAEQLRLSILLAMALNPQIRILRVTDGSRLDAASMAMLEKMATEHDYQVWIEVVRSRDDGVGFYIEDGTLTAVEGKSVGGAS